MKLAEALQRRADLNRKLAELRSRIRDNAITQEGIEPPEKPEELLAEYDSAIEEYGWLIAQINLTNCKTVRNGRTLTEIIARKDALNAQLAGYREIADAANQNTLRARNTGIRIYPTLNVREIRKKADDIAREIRELDNLLQETNWTTSLIES